MNVIKRDNSVAGLLACRFDDVDRRLFIFQCGFGLACAEGVARDSGDTDSYIAYHAGRIDFYSNGGATDCESGRLLSHLEICASALRGLSGDLNLPDDLVWFERGRHHIDKELR